MVPPQICGRGEDDDILLAQETRVRDRIGFLSFWKLSSPYFVIYRFAPIEAKRWNQMTTKKKKIVFKKVRKYNSKNRNILFTVRFYFTPRKSEVIRADKLQHEQNSSIQTAPHSNTSYYIHTQQTMSYYLYSILWVCICNHMVNITN